MIRINTDRDEAASTGARMRGQTIATDRHNSNRASSDRDMSSVIEVSIPASPRFVVVARQTVEAVCAEIEMSTSDRAAVRLSVGEACNNAVLHSPLPEDRRSSRHVIVTCRLETHALEIDVTNDGLAQLPALGSKMPDPLSEHGRGMVLIEAMMDSVEYLSHNNRTTVRMRKIIAPVPVTE